MLAWAFTTAGQTDAQLFTKCAMEAVQHADDFNAKGQWEELANVAWTLATAGEPLDRNEVEVEIEHSRPKGRSLESAGGTEVPPRI